MRVAKPSTLVFSVLLAIIIGGGVGVITARVSGTFEAGMMVSGVVAAFVLAVGIRRPLRRLWAVRRPLPSESTQWLRAHIPYYAQLDEKGREQFERDVQLFLLEQTIEAVPPATVDDSVRMSIAAGAALLLHGRPDWEFGIRRSFLVYPGSFDEDYTESKYAAYDGMAHEQGPVIFSREALLESWRDPTDGSNVVLHELAHLFDFDQASADGVPSLVAATASEAWTQLVRREMRKVRMRRSMLRGYAGTNEAELFAVAVETFFERPAEMHRRHRALFDALHAVFQLDPRLSKDEDARTDADEATARTPPVE